MNPDCKKPRHGQFDPIDRLSDLPDFIIHHIISFLGTKEGCRTCILSKRWSDISATNPVMEFRPVDFSDDTTEFLEYIETRMRKCSKENLRVRKLTLEFCEIDMKLSCLVDEWLKIAVHNQVEDLVFQNPNGRYYRLPDILLSAKSLRTLDCHGVEIPYYRAVNLASLGSLFLYEVIVNDSMLNQIFSSCLLLKHFGLSACSGFKSIVIPRCSTLETIYIVETLPLGGTVILETSSLQYLRYMGNLGRFEDWPIISKASLLRNLRILDISYASIADEVVGKLLSELTLLETLMFCNCRVLSTLRISSTRLQEFHLNHCNDLLDVFINAPRLKLFKHKCQQYPSVSIAISSQAGCDISLHTTPFNLDTDGFAKLKKLLTGLSSCNVLKVLLLDDLHMQAECDDIKFIEEELTNIQLGPHCYVKELKLTLSSWILSKSSISAFLDGLFWICHPDIISFRVNIRSQEFAIEPLISKLEDMARCWKHPLKRVEVGGANCSDLLMSRKLDVMLKLHW